MLLLQVVCVNCLLLFLTVCITTLFLKLCELFIFSMYYGPNSCFLSSVLTVVDCNYIIPLILSETMNTANFINYEKVTTIAIIIEYFLLPISFICPSIWSLLCLYYEISLSTFVSGKILGFKHYWNVRALTWDMWSNFAWHDNLLLFLTSANHTIWKIMCLCYEIFCDKW